jgi:hypothetical protein
MDHPLVIVALTVAGVILLKLALDFALSGGDFTRVKLSRRAGLRILRDPEFAARVDALLAPPPPPDTRPKRPSGAPIRALVLLQREGRLVDFLLEDIQGLDNEQIGAAVRDIHRDCQKALRDHLVLEPVMRGEERSTVEVPPGFDPSAVRLTGNVTGQPPFKGTLQHHGWRVTEIKLGPPPEGQDDLVLQPAEVELP